MITTIILVFGSYNL